MAGYTLLRYLCFGLLLRIFSILSSSMSFDFLLNALQLKLPLRRTALFPEAVPLQTVDQDEYEDLGLIFFGEAYMVNDIFIGCFLSQSMGSWLDFLQLNKILVSLRPKPSLVCLASSTEFHHFILKINV